MQRSLLFVLTGSLGLTFSCLQLFQDAAWIKPFFYIFAWWSYLVLINGLNSLIYKKSLWSEEPMRFVRLALISIPWWLFYELLNLRLKNWVYWEVPELLGIRWVGYALAYATVLPAILETSDFFHNFFNSNKSPQMDSASIAGEGKGEGEDWRKFITACTSSLGVLSFILPLIWPSLFFPLVWGGAVLILEPLLVWKNPDASWAYSLCHRRPQQTYALLLSGIACGFLWELFNYWAGAKWSYTIPWPKGPKLFEMPLLGYLGFLPFALGCCSFWAFFDNLWKAMRPSGRRWTTLGLAALSLIAFRSIDRFTVQTL